MKPFYFPLIFVVISTINQLLYLSLFLYPKIVKLATDISLSKGKMIKVKKEYSVETSPMQKNWIVFSKIHAWRLSYGILLKSWKNVSIHEKWVEFFTRCEKIWTVLLHSSHSKKKSLLRNERKKRENGTGETNIFFSSEWFVDENFKRRTSKVRGKSAYFIC